MNPPVYEIHTGTIWDAACKKYCSNDCNAFPLVLGCFYDKTHTDLHGLLACAPFICTPAFLNRKCRSNDSNYMVLGNIPNLGWGKGKAKKQTLTMSTNKTQLLARNYCTCLLAELNIFVTRKGPSTHVIDATSFVTM